MPKVGILRTPKRWPKLGSWLKYSAEKTRFLSGKLVESCKDARDEDAGRRCKGLKLAETSSGKSSTLSSSAQRIQDVLAAAGKSLVVQELPQTTRTANDAATAIGCAVAQIAKSIVFRGADGQPVLVVASGINRVDPAKVASLVGQPIGKADADYVREQTGFVIGGTPPLGHLRAITTLIDEDLLSLEEIWAAAGTPNAVFCLRPADLVELTGGKIAVIKA